MAERPDLDDRDPATLTDLEKLAYAYPEVAELLRERDALRDLVRAAAIGATESDAELHARNVDAKSATIRAAGMERERDEARAEAERAWGIAGGGRCECGEVLTLTKDGRLTEHEDGGERCEGSGTREHEPPNIRIAVLDADDRRELAQLRARDEAAKAVVRAAEGLHLDWVLPEFHAALDALARVHGEAP
jgi:hypothetical protein